MAVFAFNSAGLKKKDDLTFIIIAMTIVKVDRQIFICGRICCVQKKFRQLRKEFLYPSRFSLKNIFPCEQIMEVTGYSIACVGDSFIGRTIFIEGPKAVMQSISCIGKPLRESRVHLLYPILCSRIVFQKSKSSNARA